MGSGYYGEPSLGNERGTGSSSSSSSSSRRGKKGGSDKQPRQPQRGLGVAQLEKIRLHGEIASAAFHPTSYAFNNESELTNVHRYSPVSTSSSPSYGFPSNVMMGFGESEGRRVRDGDSQHSTAARWDPSNGGILEAQHFAHPNMTSHLQDPQAEWAAQSRRQEMGENCEACESQELDLELRLSII
ncbi:protein SPEAR3-like [Cucurbita pepo subsp. pepo]|uniref:protein SPEAR3-like n=1 Tax=Cucurbita pepo subsp. pepo TaxID=3664 RepID=UPI000C9D70AE|nr:protein SPEAR3-like [Cucurbita pepo subsp. pepo]